MKDFATGPASLSMTVHRTRQEAPSSVSASASGDADRVQATVSADSAGSSCIRSQSALASRSSPVITNSMELRQPPSSLTQTLSCSGGALPRTALTRTRSGPSWLSSIVSRWVVTSGLR